MPCYRLVLNRCIFTVKTVIYGTGINKHRDTAVGKIKTLEQKIFLILQRKAALYMVEVNENIHTHVIYIYIFLKVIKKSGRFVQPYPLGMLRGPGDLFPSPMLVHFIMHYYQSILKRRCWCSHFADGKSRLRNSPSCNSKLLQKGD